MATDKGSGAVKKVFGMFFDFEDKKNIPESKPEVKQEEVIAQQAAPVEKREEAVIEVSAPPPTTSVVGEVDDKMKQDLISAIEKANIEGYDYFEFKEALFNMEAVIPTESSRFKAAYAAVAAMVTSEHLIETANTYIGVLKEKKEAFEGYVQHMRDERVSGNENEAAKCEEQIQQKQETIIKLNQEISELQEQKKEAQQKAISENANIQQVELNFKTTLEGIIKKIDSDIIKIKTYLAPPKEEKVEVKDE